MIAGGEADPLRQVVTTTGNPSLSRHARVELEKRPRWCSSERSCTCCGFPRSMHCRATKSVGCTAEIDPNRPGLSVDEVDFADPPGVDDVLLASLHRSNEGRVARDNHGLDVGPH